jgi:outer membrane protein W
MKRISILIVLLSFFVSAAWSQTQEEQKPYSPKKGEFTLGVNFGTGSYLGWPSPRPDLSEYTLSAPMTAWFDKSPLLGVEAQYFLSDKWALKLTGGFAYGYNPGYREVTGTGSEQGDIPTYNAVPSSSNLQYAVTAGGDYYFATKIERLFFRLGGELGFAYGRITRNAADSEAYMGASIGEAYSLRVAPVCGVDYFLNQSLFLGLEVRPLAYGYSVYGERPQVGMKLLSSDNHSFSILAQPMIKLGFRF